MPVRRSHRVGGRVGLLTAVLGVGVLATGCGASATAPGPPATSITTPTSTTSTTTPTSTTAPPSRSTTPTIPATPDSCGVVAGPHVVIAKSPFTCQVTVRSGDTVQLVLSSGFNWNDPVSSSASVRVTDVQRPDAGGLTAFLVVVAPGRATVSASGTVVCPPEEACPALARLYRVAITVTPA